MEWKGNVCFSSLIISHPGICEFGFTAVETFAEYKPIPDTAEICTKASSSCFFLEYLV